MHSNAEREALYKKQNGSDKLTPAQRRRVNAKKHREADRMAGKSFEEHVQDAYIESSDETAPENEYEEAFIGAAHDDTRGVQREAKL